MSHANPFLKPADYYQRAINPIGQYVDQMAYFLMKMTGKPLEQTRPYMVNGIRKKLFSGIDDPIVDYFERNDYGDREKKEIPLSAYITDAVKKGEIIVPTFTTYKPAHEERSILSSFVGGNVKTRAVAKKDAGVAEAEGDMILYRLKNNEQANMKTYNNSLSGAFAAEGSILANPTGHNTLTSITRSMASVGNALSERNISGNRHYRSPDVTLYNVITAGASMDRKLVTAAMEKYQLRFPTVQETMEVIQKSTRYYWNDPRKMAEIQSLVEKYDPWERAFFVYGTDLFHVRKLNPEFMRRFIDRLRDKSQPIPEGDPVAFMKTVDHMVVNYAQQVCMTEVRGKGTTYAKMDTPTVETVARVSNNINRVIEDYKLFIDAFFLTRMVPCGTAYIPAMVREAVVLSDTDSSMFAIDEWVIWFYGDLQFHDEAYGVAGAVMFFSTQCIAHSLAILSANMGVERKELFTLAMKPEFVFPIFGQTAVAKHYFTCQLVKEGMVRVTPQMEIKGVHLKNSAAPVSIVSAGQQRMQDILFDAMQGKKVSLTKEIKDIADLERSIHNSLMAGEVEYFKRSKVKTAKAYVQEATRSPYQHHVFWEMIFAPKYGDVAPPPYSVLKVPTILTTPTATKLWLENLADQELAKRFLAWMQMHNKKKLPTVYISLDYVTGFNIPQEIKSIINVKKIVLDLTNVRRMVLDTVGHPIKSGWTLSEMGY